MAITFRESPRPTLGVEVEIQLIDRLTWRLASQAIAMLDAAAVSCPALRLTSELNQAMLEINTEICPTVQQVGESLRRQLSMLRDLADARGLALATAGTHPIQDWRELKIYPKARYYQILEKFQWLARRLTTFGLHVHVGVRNGDRAVAIMNELVYYIPHLLALSASSPYWGRRDTGLASSRVAIFEAFPTGGVPHFLQDWHEFQECFNILSANGAIHSIKDIYWDIRPHFDFGTIEVRICDGVATLPELLAITALIQCLVVWLDEQQQVEPSRQRAAMRRYWLAPENKWQAARYGLEGQITMPDVDVRRCIGDEVDRLVTRLQPVAVRLHCETELLSVRTILTNGASAARQRAAYRRQRSYPAIVQSLVQEFEQGISGGALAG